MGQAVLYTTEFNWHVVLMGHPRQPYLQTMSAATSQTLIATHIALHSMVFMRYGIHLTSGIRWRFSIAFIRKQHPKMRATEHKRCITSGKMAKFEGSYKLGPKDPAKGD